jgi:dynein heavy chain
MRMALHAQDTYILGGVDEVMVVLEDTIMMISTILSSRFVAGIRRVLARK